MAKDDDINLFVPKLEVIPILSQERKDELLKIRKERRNRLKESKDISKYGLTIQ